MKLLDQVKNPDDSYTVRVWLDEVAPDAIKEYSWAAWSEAYGTKVNYEKSQVDQALALAALELPADDTHTVIKSDKSAIEEQTAAADESTDNG